MGDRGLLEGEPLQGQAGVRSHLQRAGPRPRDDVGDRSILDRRWNLDNHIDAVWGDAADLVGDLAGAVVGDWASAARASSAFSSPLTVAITRAPAQRASWIAA